MSTETNTIRTRIKHPFKSVSEWNQSTIILLPGEVAYTDDGKYKIGDGRHTFSELPWPAVSDHTHASNEIIKFGTKAYWREHNTYIPAEGEIIIVTDFATDSNGDNVPAIKVGDGLAYAVDLPYVAKNIKDLLDTHVADSVIHITGAERAFWNSKWSGYLDENSPETLVFTIN